MSYEAKLDYYQKYIEPELIKQQQEEYAEEAAAKSAEGDTNESS